jgi:predicted nucleotidyltransferase
MKLVYDSETLRRFCQERGIARLELFGSALRDDFRPESDVDLLCTLTKEKDQACGLLEWVDLQLGLQDIFGRPVDLLSRSAVEHSRNPYRRATILANPEPLYVEG